MTLAAESQRIAEETVQFASDGFTIRACVARPTDRPGRLPAVVILHEWWGLNEHVVDVARRFAGAGYVGAALDLYSRQGCKVTGAPEAAAALMNALSSQAALRDINALGRHLKAQPFVDPQRLGLIGFSMGGTLALTMATHNSDFRAVVVFYGKVPPIESLDSLLAPVQFHYAGRDGWVTRQEAERLQQAFAQFGKPGEVIMYPEADHAFFNDTRPEVSRREDAAHAWRRTLQFFAAHVR
jgi:carboxymethylenebutenolidase